MIAIAQTVNEFTNAAKRCDVRAARRANWCAMKLARNGAAPAYVQAARNLRNSAMRSARARAQAQA